MRSWFERRPALTPTARRNITSIAELEHQLEAQRSAFDRAGDAITGFVGSVRFIAAHVAWSGAWVAWNAGVLAGLPSSTRTHWCSSTSCSRSRPSFCPRSC
jgi:uncharacterized membrane protein